MDPMLQLSPEQPQEQTKPPVLVCVIPAYNEANSIGNTLDSLLDQTRVPDRIAIMVNNTTDRTLDVCKPYEGEHVRVVMGEEFRCVIDLIDMGRVPDKKVGALNAGYEYAKAHGADYMLGCDGDTSAPPEAIAQLLAEIVSDPRIGGVSAKYSISKRSYKDAGILARLLLIPGQRAQFAAFNLDNLLRGRQMAVLGGQFSIFSVPAMTRVTENYHQKAPWTRDSAVEDSLLSLQLVDSGFLTKISATAHAYVGAMTTVRALHAQQVKWTQGFLDLMSARPAWRQSRQADASQPASALARASRHDGQHRRAHGICRPAGDHTPYPRLRLELAMDHARGHLDGPESEDRPIHAR